MNNKKPNYDFKSDFFRKNPLYKRLAKDHLSLAEFEHENIEWEVANTRSPKKIPCEYLIHYNMKTIVGINDDSTPIYGDRHTVNIKFPPNYPIESPLLYMTTKVWHPNIKSEGRYAGRICGNTKGFGMSFDLTMLMMRIAEILEYKNYHATHTPPFPEDAKVADWITSYAEPNKIVSKKDGLNSAKFDAYKAPPPPENKEDILPTEPEPLPTPPPAVMPKKPEAAPQKRKLTITGVRKVPKAKIKIERKKNE